nr:small EDRK-rich factor 1 isoform X1 [Peromyscus maniculatus bairdii]
MELGLPLMLGKPHLQPYVFPLPCFGSWVVWEVGPGSFGAHPTTETRRRLKLLQFRPSGRGQLPGSQRLNGLWGDVRLFGPGGNQRELARQKNMKKTQEISKGKRKEDSLTTSQRKQRDSEIMQQKQKIANEKKSMQTREK